MEGEQDEIPLCFGNPVGTEEISGSSTGARHWAGSEYNRARPDSWHVVDNRQLEERPLE
jgi:hypothetical protein